MSAHRYLCYVDFCNENGMDDELMEFNTCSSPEVFIRRITGPSRDSYVQTPEYKITAVRIEKAVT